MATNLTRRPPIPIFDNLKATAGLPTRELQHPSSVLPVEAIQRDYELCWQFPVSYDGSTATFTAYRRELELLCQWSWHIHKASILTLTRDDIERFIRFIQKPPVAWIGSKNFARFVQRDGRWVPNPAWRPFVVNDTDNLYCKR